MNANDEITFTLTAQEYQNLMAIIQQTYQIPLQLVLKMNQQAQPQIQAYEKAAPGPAPKKGNSGEAEWHS